MKTIRQIDLSVDADKSVLIIISENEEYPYLIDIKSGGDFVKYFGSELFLTLEPDQALELAKALALAAKDVEDKE